MMEAFDVGGTVNTADDGDEHHDDDQQHQTHHNNSKAAHEITPFIYQKDYQLKDLIKISKVFKLCDNITEVISYINENFESNLVTLKEENIDSVNLYFKMTLPNKSEENFKFEISKINLKQNESFDILFKGLYNIKNENKKKDEEIEILKTEINNLKQQMNSMKIEFEKKNKEISDQLFSLLNKKDILKNKIFKNLIENAVKEKREEIKNKNIEWKLIYKASRDGESVSNCHSKCKVIQYQLFFLQMEEYLEYIEI